MPISSACGRLAACSVSAHATVVPWPPRKGTLPRKTPSAAGRPKALAMATPIADCAMARTAISTHSSATAPPPRDRRRNLAVSPSEAKKISNSALRNVSPKVTLKSATPPMTASRIAISRPPVTAGGMLYSASTGTHRLMRTPSRMVASAAMPVHSSFSAIVIV